jgi:hypothetical protein
MASEPKLTTPTQAAMSAVENALNDVAGPSPADRADLVARRLGPCFSP